MHTFWFVLFFLVAFFWVFYGLRVGYGAWKLPRIKDFAAADDSDCPSISLLFAARDEEEKLPAALASKMALDYPRLEIIGVDDRSEDATGRILNEAAARHSGLRVLHIGELPPGWLGKPYALQLAYEASTGEWLLFTDADVRFRADVLRRAVTLAKQHKLDHLTLFGDLEMAGFWERVLLTFFSMAFYMATDPYRIGNPHSRSYAGIGGFQLIARSAYEASGTHRRLAMEVVDDMKLGKIVKEAGFRSGLGIAHDSVAVRWHAGIGNMIRGVTKNFFAGAGYNLPLVIFAVAGVLVVNIAPFLGIFLGHGWIRALSAAAVLIALCMHAGVSVVMRVSPLYALTHPVGTLIFCYMILRSTVVTLWQGGVTWRGTFYPLRELKRRLV